MILLLSLLLLHTVCLIENKLRDLREVASPNTEIKTIFDETYGKKIFHENNITEP